MTQTAGELAKYLGATLQGDAGALLAGIASPANAREMDLIYLDSPRHRERVEKSRAKCVLAQPGERLAGKTIIETANPKLAFAKAAAWLLPPARAAAQPSIPPPLSPPSAKLSADVSVGPYAVIEEEAEDWCRHAASMRSVFSAGALASARHCRLHPRVTLYAGAQLGNRVEIHSGAVIGADGFGYVYGEGRHWKFPQIGTVRIGDDVEIGANTTIDRGSLDSTDIARGVKIDNLVQVAHNVQIGEHSVLAAQTGVSGSSVLGRRVIVGGQVGIADHCTLEDGAIAGAQAGIPTGKTIRSGQTVWGTPARPLEKFKKQYAWLARLPELAERVRSAGRRIRSSAELSLSGT